ncbi:MAG: hypothetical protein Fur0037_01790 [Planctomycetota bacterium]
MSARPMLAPILLDAGLAAQEALILTAMPTAPRARLLRVDASGSWTAMPGFPSDGLPPLALAIDPYDGAAVVALAEPGGGSRLVRLSRMGSTGAERVIGTAPGTCTALLVAGDEMVATFGGANGGLCRIPRLGGFAFPVTALPHAAAIESFGPQSAHVVLAWDQAPGTSQGPGFGLMDFEGNQWWLRWHEPTFGARSVTGVADLPTALVRELVAFADGSFGIATYGGPPPTAVATSPPIPPGGAAAMKAPALGSTAVLAVGSSAFPFLYRLDAFAPPPNVAILAGPLPGDPVDFAPLPPAGPWILQFGEPCGAQAIRLSVQGVPRIGDPSLSILLAGAQPATFSLLAVGFSDELALGSLPLPFVLPGQCALRVSPDGVVARVTDALGRASVPFGVPNDPGLAGLLLYAQWAQAASPQLSVSDSAAILIGI